MSARARWAGVALLLAAGEARAADPASPYGINTHVPSAADLDRVAQAGIAWVRVDFNWLQLEPADNQYNWAISDAVVNAASARGLNVFATLAYTPGWANGGQSGAVPPVDPQKWADFVTAVVGRYKGKVKHWGMWNEPNLTQFWTGTAQQYVYDILIRGADAARAADPGCFILGPELAHLSSGHWAAWLYYVLTQAGDTIDIVTQHVYEGSGDEVIRALEGYLPFWEKPTVLGVMDAAGYGGMPLWLTETGWHTDEVSQEQQALYYEQLLEGVLEETYLEKVFFYELKDDPNITDKWGILEADLTPKQAYHRYAEFIASH